MNFTAQEHAILDIFDRAGSPRLRLQQIAGAPLAAVAGALVQKRILAPADGEYWLTEQGVQLLRQRAQSR